MRMLLQFPEGLKQKARELAAKYKEEGHEVFLSASACYGACDLALDEARWIKADKIVHVGHNKFIKKDLEIPVEYIPYYVDIDIEKLENVLPKIEQFEKIALATTVQHIHQFEEMKAFFEKHGKKVFAAQGSVAKEVGQVLGCDATCITKVEDQIDAVVFVSSGAFHPLAINIKKPVFAFSPYDFSVKNIEDGVEKVRKRRKGAIAKALTCQNFGILLSTKPGQFAFETARSAKENLEKHGFKASILVANEFDPLSVNNFLEFDCFINTACPRIADDQEKFGKPILNMDMLHDLFEIIDAN